MKGIKKMKKVKKYEDFKIRKMLGKNYHLFEEYDYVDSEYKVIEWKLFERPDNPSLFFSNDNKAIMTSETNTMEDLYKFAKKHRKYEFHDILKTMAVISIILMILSFIAIILNFPNYAKGMIIGAILIEIIIDIIAYEMSNHNFEVEMKRHKEYFKRHMEDLENELDIEKNTKRKK